MFKGSTQPRVLNQHLKRSKIHLQERKRRLNLDELPDSFEGEASLVPSSVPSFQVEMSALLYECTANIGLSKMLMIRA